MCWCDPSIRTPYCGRPGCIAPELPRVCSEDAIARELYDVMLEHLVERQGRPRMKMLDWDHLPHDMRDGWRAVARHVRHVYP